MVGLSVKRQFTKAGIDPFSTVTWTKRTSRITNPDGSVVFEMADAEVPESWSQVATDIMVSKYFRKAGVPQFDEQGLPLRTANGTQQLGPERSAKQVIHRLAGCWRWWGESNGYFATPEDAQAFVNFLASDEGQEAIADSYALEYPLNPDVALDPPVKPFDELEPPTVDVSSLNSEKVVEMMQDAGLL